MMYALLLAVSLLPIHATVLAVAPQHTVIARTRGATLQLKAGIYRFRIPHATAFRPGVGVDGLLDRATKPWTLRDAVPARPFVAGLPARGKVVTIDLGSTLPNVTLVDSAGHPFNLSTAFRGKTLLVSFIYTRCPPGDLCPLTSAKFARMQRQIDPRHMHLLEISIDPKYDSPAVLRNYGIRFGAIPSRWTLATGTGSTVQSLLDRFVISSIEDTTGHYVHNDELFIVAPNGRVAFIARSAAWVAGGALAEARSIDGETSNPFELFKLSLVASIVAACGGSEYAGVVILDIVLLTLIALAVTWILWRLARRLMRER
ncbi:MAG: SCO family protein [Candidatus Eremiobacteraeota bacterium]|nr:SCO family protein [Candidatus Eremiobacteraeota bacterium]